MLDPPQSGLTAGPTGSAPYRTDKSGDFAKRDHRVLESLVTPTEFIGFVILGLTPRILIFLDWQGSIHYFHQLLYASCFGMEELNRVSALKERELHGTHVLKP